MGQWSTKWLTIWLTGQWSSVKVKLTLTSTDGQGFLQWVSGQPNG